MNKPAQSTIIAMINAAVDQAFKLHMAKMKLIVNLGPIAVRPGGVYAAYLRIVWAE